jgi:hypothetical protein
MAVHELTLEGLSKLPSNLLVAAVNRGLEEIAADCEDRPYDKRPRTLTLTLKFVPVPNTQSANAALDEVKMKAPVVKVAKPEQVFPDVSLNFRKKRNAQGRQVGMMVFNDLSPDDAKQRTIDEQLAD